MREKMLRVEYRNVELEQTIATLQSEIDSVKNQNKEL